MDDLNKLLREIKTLKKTNSKPFILMKFNIHIVNIQDPY